MEPCESAIDFQALALQETFSVEDKIIIVINGVATPIKVKDLLKNIILPPYLSTQSAIDDGLESGDWFKAAENSQEAVPGTVFQIT